LKKVFQKQLIGRDVTTGEVGSMVREAIKRGGQAMAEEARMNTSKCTIKNTAKSDQRLRGILLFIYISICVLNTTTAVPPTWTCIGSPFSIVTFTCTVPLRLIDSPCSPAKVNTELSPGFPNICNEVALNPHKY
jgi:hypothetical protein